LDFFNLTIWWLAIALSIDSFGAGITYGMRKIRFPILPILIVGICSSIVMVLAMTFGNWLASKVPANTGSFLGAIILIILGIKAMLQSYIQNKGKDSKIEEKIEKRDENVTNSMDTKWKWHIKSLGLIIEIYKKPVMADIDKSGSISILESLILGIALSLDDIGAGIGAAFMGLDITALSILNGITSSIFIVFGLILGFYFSNKNLEKNKVFAYMPGIILILMGLNKFI